MISYIAIDSPTPPGPAASRRGSGPPGRRPSGRPDYYYYYYHYYYYVIIYIYIYTHIYIYIGGDARAALIMRVSGSLVSSHTFVFT